MNVAVALTEQGSPFRMANNDIGAAEIAQHRTGDFAGEGALLLPVEILRAKGNVGGRVQHGMH